MKRRRIIAAAVVTVALGMLASWARRAPVSLAPVSPSPERTLTEPLARAHAEAPSADSTTNSPDPLFDPELAPEQALMQAALDAFAREPRRTLALTETADRRFGTLNEGRRLLEIQALVALKMIGLSHSRAEHFYRSFPQSQAAGEIERLTGYHPRPRGP